MKKIQINIIIYCILLFAACKKENTISPENCNNDATLDMVTDRKFKMGFSTWSFGPDPADLETTYQFIKTNADIYSEQIDDKIPWDSWLNNSPLPLLFTEDIAYRVAQKPANHKLLLSVSLLNALRNNLAEDYDGTTPAYSAINDQHIENAFFMHLQYLIASFNPDYVVLAMEVNELLIKSETKWNEYKLLMKNIRTRIKQAYPNLPLSESVTLHTWYKPEVTAPTDFKEEIKNYVEELDFVAISFYPFILQQHSKSEFQQVFDFLEANVNKPIAIVETSHLAEDLDISSLNLHISASECEQKNYLETLFLNAYNNNYEFVVWWSFRDYDRLVASFPPELMVLGSVWQDTGIIDENGNERPAYTLWKQIFEK